MFYSYFEKDYCSSLVFFPFLGEKDKVKGE